MLASHDCFLDDDVDARFGLDYMKVICKKQKSVLKEAVYKEGSLEFCHHWKIVTS